MDERIMQFRVGVVVLAVGADRRIFDPAVQPFPLRYEKDLHHQGPL